MFSLDPQSVQEVQKAELRNLVFLFRALYLQLGVRQQSLNLFIAYIVICYQFLCYGITILFNRLYLSLLRATIVLPLFSCLRYYLLITVTRLASVRFPCARSLNDPNCSQFKRCELSYPILVGYRITIYYLFVALLMGC